LVGVKKAVGILRGRMIALPVADEAALVWMVARHQRKMDVAVLFILAWSRWIQLCG